MERHQETQESGGVVPSQPAGLRIGGLAAESRRPEGRRGWTSRPGGKVRRGLPRLSGPDGRADGRRRPHWGLDRFTQIQMLSQNGPHGHTQNNVAPALWGGPSAQSRWHIKTVFTGVKGKTGLKKKGCPRRMK